MPNQSSSPISSEHILVVFNPAAQAGRLKHMELDIRSALKKQLGHVSFVSTKRLGHAREIAEQLDSGIRMVVAMGGDGTVHELAAGLVAGKKKAGLAVVPLGSGNDFARALTMSSSWTESIRQLTTATERLCDVGRVSWKEADKLNEDYFVNALGVGFDAHCAVIAPRFKRWPFGIGYTASIVAGLKTWVSGGATIWDMTGERNALFAGRMMFTTIGNAQDSGGGYTINPKALISDGLVDACIVENMSFLRALSILPSARDGKHLTKREVSYHQVSELLIETDRGLPMHADGEVKSLQARTISIRVLHQALRVFTPATAPAVM